MYRSNSGSEFKTPKPRKTKYIETEKNYLTENIDHLKIKKKTTKKIGDKIIDEQKFKDMLKQFNVSVPNKPSKFKSKINLTQRNNTWKSYNNLEIKESSKYAH
jgi:hypothetical protein